MNLYSIPPLLASLIFLFFAIFVFTKNPNSIKNITYSLVCICTFIWEFSMYILFNFATRSNAVFFARIAHLGIIFIPITYFHFICSYLELRKTRVPIAIGYIISTIFAFFLWSSSVFIAGSYKYYWGYFPEAGSMHKYYLFLLAIIIFIAVRLIWKNIHSNKNNFKIYNQNKYLLLSVVFYSSASIDFLPNYGISSYPIGFIPIIVSMIIMTYAIVRHNLLDINIVIRKGLLYSILISIITIVYIVLALLIEHLFRGLFGYKSLPISILAIALIVLLFQPLKNYIQRIIDKYFFHGSIEQIDEENVKLRQELQKTEKLKAISTLAAGMAHEIKNPLTSIKTFTEYLPKKHNDPDFINKFNDIVGTEVDKINHIVKQLLEFSRPSKLNLKATDINGLLEETLSLLNNDLLKYNIKTQKDYSDIAAIDTDPSQIRQVFLNLFLNAMDSIRNDGTIHVVTNQENNGKISITISDTGQGIPKEDIGRIFDPFFTRKDEGTGLGLSVVHGIIEKHGGKITVKSVPGEGTSFVITLPIK
jgi:signal transduction histidine kinase